MTLSEDGTQNGVDVMLPAGTSISGTVYGGSGTATPLADMCVEAGGDGDGTDAGGADWYYWGYAQTAADGTYTISNLPVSSDGYDVYFYDCADGGYMSQYYGETVDPAVGEPSTGVDAHMVLGATISGTVTDASGHPVNDGCITIDDEYGDYEASGYTDASGAYSINGLATGSYTVVADDCDYDNEPHDDLAETSAAESVTAGATTGGVDLRLEPAHFNQRQGDERGERPAHRGFRHVHHKWRTPAMDRWLCCLTGAMHQRTATTTAATPSVGAERPLRGAVRQQL